MEIKWFKRKQKKKRRKDSDHARGIVSAEELKRELAALELTKDTYGKAPSHIGLRELARNIISVRSVDQLFTALGVYLKSIAPGIFTRLDHDLVSADYNEVPEVYAGRAIVVTILTAIMVYLGASFAAVLGLFALSPSAQLLAAPIAAVVVLFIYYYLPSQKMYDKRKSIDVNFPFALNHMAAIASSGAPPEKAFEILAQFKEFGGITTEAANITMRIKLFGEDITTAIQQVMKTTPSERFRELLAGILAILRSGGNLEQYLMNESKMAMFDYELNMKRYIETLATYADIYTAILIAAPLFMVSILTIMSIIPGTTLPGGLTIDTVLFGGIYLLIPILNTLFIVFVTVTQPEV